MNGKLLTLRAEGLGKKFGKDWIFRKLDLEVKTGESLAVIGANGSGKSTLLQMLAAYLQPSEGVVSYTSDGKAISLDKIFYSLSLATPYLALPEELTLEEFLAFHFHFKKKYHNIDIDGLVERMKLDTAKKKFIKHFSSGMKQRLKLGVAFYSDTPILFLDEPTMNLDQTGVEWYKEQIGIFSSQKLLVICSNQAHEYETCDRILNINNFK